MAALVDAPPGPSSALRRRGVGGLSAAPAAPTFARRRRGARAVALGAPPTVRRHLMTARRVSDGAWITWEVDDAPDGSAAQAPEAVTLSTVAVVRTRAA